MCLRNEKEAAKSICFMQDTQFDKSDSVFSAQSTRSPDATFQHWALFHVIAVNTTYMQKAYFLVNSRSRVMSTHQSAMTKEIRQL